MAEFDLRAIAGEVVSGDIVPVAEDLWKKYKAKFTLPDLHNVNASLLLGSPYFQKLTVSDKAGNLYTFPNEPLISLSVTKTIVETATVGKYRKGTVKEYITTEDYSIKIDGVIFGEDQDIYPAKEVEELNNLFHKNEALKFESNPFLELFGIRKMVLTDLDFDSMEGKQGLQTYSISAKSDIDFYAELTGKDIVSRDYLNSNPQKFYA